LSAYATRLQIAAAIDKVLPLLDDCRLVTGSRAFTSGDDRPREEQLPYLEYVLRVLAKENEIYGKNHAGIYSIPYFPIFGNDIIHVSYLVMIPSPKSTEVVNINSINTFHSQQLY
jgi:hypothetical protein